MSDQLSLDPTLDRDGGASADAPFETVVRGAGLPILIADARRTDQPIIMANDAFLKLTGYHLDEVLGRNCRFLQGPDTDPSEVDKVRRAIRDGQDATAELLNYRKDGSTFWNSLHLSPVRNAQGEITYWFGCQTDVSERKAQQLALLRSREALLADVNSRTQDLEAALAQKTALLHEVDHRVKNNLQLISSLMLLQSRRLEDERTRLALRGMLERVSAIATVHRRLFQSADVTRFDVAEFIRDLTGDLAGSAGRDDLQLRLDLEHVAVPASQAAPLALVVNELIGNALKHAFPDGRPGVVTVSTRTSSEGCILRVEDDGIGLPPGAPPRNFGMTIVQLLCQQLRARLELQDRRPGLGAVVTIPVDPALFA
ncbi:histidine kinase dimerization/phosphoacceptor domain -containing protein [Phenylobacterium deserti]|uniref:Histidine kinase n=1 Tax=Phenylobacterium deserti TaxID=1914756 RepID=A0A328AYH1_9CAUL|nr:PAS domain-containing protein [Phenylobacterium deserti]RAK57878.1 histidine kinase [Phenylobacterium deserti]